MLLGGGKVAKIFLSCGSHNSIVVQLGVSGGFGAQLFNISIEPGAKVREIFRPLIKIILTRILVPQNHVENHVNHQLFSKVLENPRV